MRHARLGARRRAVERETLVEILRQSDPETLTLHEGPPLEAEAKEGAQLTLLLQSGSRALGELGPAQRVRLFERHLELTIDAARCAIDYAALVGLKVSAREKSRAGFRR